MTIFIILTTVILFTTPYYYAYKLGMKEVNKWFSAVYDIKMAENKSYYASDIYKDYSDAPNFYYDYFYKDEEKAAYWLNKYNELKAQGK